MAFKNADQAEAYDMALTADGYESKTVGAIDGDAYLVVYYKPAKATKKAKRCNCTTAGKKGPQDKAQAHRCRDCPECAVLFDSDGIHGHVPDGNSKTCRACERNREAGQ